MNIGKRAGVGIIVPGLIVTACVTALSCVPVGAQSQQPIWLADKNSGCKVRVNHPTPNWSITWSGACTDGIASGHGTVQILSDGALYASLEGDFDQGEVNGAGILTHASGQRYTGQLQHSQPNGHGVRTYPDGTRYEGEWKDNRRNGRGTAYYPNGSRYEGEWNDSKRSGRGTYYFPDKSWYEGEFKDDKPNGHGVRTYADSSRYEGEWKDGKRNGRGTAYSASGAILQSGEWVEGRFVQQAAGVDAEGNPIAAPQVSNAARDRLNHAEAITRAMNRVYEYYVERGQVDKADDELISFVQYVRHESALIGISPAELFTSSNLGPVSAWNSTEQDAAQATVRRRTRPNIPDNKGGTVTDCDGDGLGGMTCFTERAK